MTTKTKKKSATKTADNSNRSRFKDNIIHWVAPKSVTSNPLNWRDHPPGQIGALQEAYQAIGFVAPILVNCNSNHIVDGHGRVEAAIKKGLKAVPVILLDITESEERMLLQNLDSIQAMGIINAQKVKELIASNTQAVDSLEANNKKELEKLHKTLKDYSTIKSVAARRTPETIFSVTEKISKRRTDREEDKTVLSTEENKVAQVVYRDDITFDGDEEWGIPELLTDPRLLCNNPPKQTYDRSPESNRKDSYYCYSARPADRPTPGGTLGFFCDDYRFSAIFDKCPEYVLQWKEQGWTNIVEPDFSIYDKDPSGNPHPFPLNLYALYRSRFILRYCQEVGIRIIPQLRWTSDEKIFDAAVNSLPKRLPWLIVQMRSNLASRPPDEIDEIGSALEDALAITEPQGLIVYGDVNLEEWLRSFLPKKTNLLLLRDYMNVRWEQRERTRKSK